jgi:aryl-alcohol dehydrogenase-like predicted oxidoreductase
VRGDGLTKKIGVSAYGPADLAAAWSADFDIVQAPFNVLDQRLLTTGWLDRFAKDGVEFHARSVFLQGVLLMPAAQRHGYFNRWTPLFERWQDWLSQHGGDAVKACLDFALAHDGISHVVVGVQTHEQLHQVIHAASTPRLPALAAGFASDDVALIEPYRWSAN